MKMRYFFSTSIILIGLSLPWLSAPRVTIISQSQFYKRASRSTSTFSSDNLELSNSTSLDSNYQIAYTSDETGNEDIFLINADGTGKRNLTNNADDDFDPEWSPNGEKIAFVSIRSGISEIYTMNADGTGINRLTPGQWGFQPHWSPDGKKIAFLSSSVNNDLVVMNADGTGKQNLTNDQQIYSDLAWSPDSKSIAIVKAVDFISDIYIFKVDGSGWKRLTNLNSPTISSPKWSPSGEKIAFASDINGNFDIFTINLDGSGLTNITNSPADELLGEWSPDGTLLSLSIYQNGDSDGYTINIDGTGRTQIDSLPSIDGLLTWSSDQNKIAFFADYAYRDNAIYVVNADGSGLQQITRPYFTFLGAPKWRPLPVDLSVSSVVPVQALFGNDLVKDKATAVEVIIQKTGQRYVNNVSVSLDMGSYITGNFFVAEDSNTDEITHALINDNSAYPLDFSPGESTKTIYFIDPRIIPTGSSFQVTANVDYLDQIPEMDESATSNERTSPPISVHDTVWTNNLLLPALNNLRIQYFRTDWNTYSSLSNFINYTDNFLRNVLPISSERYESNFGGFLADTTTNNFRNLNSNDNKLDDVEIGLWLRAVDVSMHLAHPSADRYVAVVPEHWFTTNTVFTQSLGISDSNISTVIAEARTTTRPNGLSTAAHEIGHTYKLPVGLPKGCDEEYLICNPSRDDKFGNLAAPGFFVGARIPIQIQSDRKVYCMMSTYDPVDIGRPEYWIDAQDYSFLLTKHSSVSQQFSGTTTLKTILATGVFGKDGTVELKNWYLLDTPSEQTTLTPGPYSFEYLDQNSNVINEISFDIGFSLEGGFSLDQSPFVFTIPYYDNTSDIAIKFNGSVIGQKVISPNSPSVTLISPDNGELYEKNVVIDWSGDDIDGDSLSYTVLISPDNGTTWEPIAFEISGTSFTWDISSIPPGMQYRVKIIATDGFNTGETEADGTFTIIGHTYIPVVLK